jgi:hypothetical protein
LEIVIGVIRERQQMKGNEKGGEEHFAMWNEKQKVMKQKGE